MSTRNLFFLVSLVLSLCLQGRQAAHGASFNFSSLGGPVEPVGPVSATGEDTVALLVVREWSRDAWSRVKPRSVRPEQTEARALILAEEAALLYGFTKDYSNSLWTPAIQLKLGQFYRQAGRYSRALELWSSAWESTKREASGQAKVVADGSLCRYLVLLCGLGRYEALTDLLAETEHRRLPFDADAQFYLRALEAYRHMTLNPGKSYRCGTYALAAVSDLLYPGNAFTPNVRRVPSPASGFTVQQLTDFCGQLGIGLVPVHWGDNPQLVVPSVVHWRENHYAAIMEQKGNWFRVADPTTGGESMLRVEDILAEASGYFLVPANRIPAGWRVIDSAERAAVYGRGYDTVLRDECDDLGCPHGKGPGGTGGSGGPSSGGCGASCKIQVGESKPGMPFWHVSRPYTALWLLDTPLNYQPALGDEMAVHLMYRQRGIEMFAAWSEIGFTMVGSGWNLPWRGAISSSWGGSYGSATMYLATGTKLQAELEGGYTTSAPNYFNNSQLEWHFDVATNVTGHTIYYPDGSADVFGFAVTNADGYVSRFALSSRIDAHGHETQIEYFDYDPEVGYTIIKRVIDPDGHALTFSYASLDVYGNGSVVRTNFVSSITDWANRTVQLRYNTNTLDLIKIVDAAGITNHIDYDAYHVATNLVTPYGTTSFQHFDIRANHAETRHITITEPNGAKQRYRYESADATVWDAVDPLSNGYTPPSGTPFDDSFDTVTDDRNSYHWDARNFEELSSDFKNDPDNNEPTESDYVRAHARHWIGDQAGGGTDTHTLSSERASSPDGATEGQLTFYNYEGTPSSYYSGTQILPAVIARVMPDGSTWYEYYERNDIGLVTEKVEKWVAGGSTQYRTNTYVYDSNGIDLLGHYGPEGTLEVGYAYSASHPHQPIRMTNALNEVTYYTYDGSDRQGSVQTPGGLLTTNIYGGDGYLQTSIDSFVGGSALRTNSFTWLDNYLRTRTDERGLTITNTYDNLGRLTQVDYPDSTYELNDFTIASPYASSTGGTNILDRTAHRDRLGNWTFYQWTENRQLYTVTDPRTNVTAYGYCDCGSLHSITNAPGTSLQEVTSFVYDESGKLLETYHPDGSSFTNRYDLPGRLVINSDALGSTTNHFDNLNRLVAVSNYFGRVQALSYDAEDRLLTSTDANGVTVTNTYDALGRTLTRTHPDSGLEKWGYTAGVSAPTTHTNQLNNVWTYAYDPAGRKTNEIGAGLYTNKFTYSAASDLKTLTDGKNQVTTWNYDLHGRVTNKVDQASAEILRYSYDANSRLTNRWSTAKGDTAYSYDAAGNQTNVNYPSGTTDISLSYDALNRVTNMVDAIGTTAYAYWPGGLLKTEDGPWASDTVTNSYNTARLRTDLVLVQPTGTWTNRFAYDAGHRLTNVTSKAGAFNYQYSGTQPSTLIQKLSLPNTSYITNTYDTSARLTGTYLKKSDHTELNKHEYLYNAGNQRTRHTRTDASYYTNTYDAIGQLQWADSTVASEDRGYLYDAAWNLNTRTNNGATTTFSVDNKNSLTNVAGNTYRSDGNGNLTNYYDGGAHRTNVYDAENQMIEAVAYTTWRSTFAYDGRGRLRERKDYEWWGTPYNTWNLTNTVRGVYDGMRVIQERSSANTPTVSYTRGHDLSGTMEGAGGIGGLLSRSHGYSGGNWSTHNHYHCDGGGNITYLVNSSQAIAASYKYDPYGNTISSSGTLAAANVYRFSSKPIHSPSGMYYYGYRWYSPNLQRWLNRDPLGEIGFDLLRQIETYPLSDGPNSYAFVRNNPMCNIDPFGLLTEGEKAYIELLKKLKEVFDQINNGEKCSDPCTSVVSLRAVCDCMWQAVQDNKTKPKQIPTEVAKCMCAFNAEDEGPCKARWEKRIKVIFSDGPDRKNKKG